MSQHYSDPRRVDDPHALPNVEVFYHNHEDAIFMVPRSCEHVSSYSGECPGTGWYWWACFPGCLPDSDPCGPFPTKAEALADAQEGSDDFDDFDDSDTD